MVQKPDYLPNYCKDSAGASSPREKAAMENSRVDELRAEVSRLLEKQSEVLEAITNYFEVPKESDDSTPPNEAIDKTAAIKKRD